MHVNWKVHLQTLENCRLNISVDSMLFAVLKFSMPCLVHTIIFDSFVTMNIASLGDKINFLWAAAIARPIFKENSSTGLSVKKNQVDDYLYFYLQCEKEFASDTLSCINS